MGLRIKTNVASITAQRHLETTSNLHNKSMGRLASGFRINRAADDAAGLAVSEGMKAKIVSLRQAKRNASDGISLIQTAEGSMQEMGSILIRLRELAVQASTDTMGNTERSFANREYSQLVDEIDRIANTTEYSRKPLLKGSEEFGSEEISIHVGAGDASRPNTDNVMFQLSELRLSPINEVLQLNSGSEIGPVNPREEDFSREDASQKLTLIDEAIEKIAGTRADLGAKQSRLNSAIGTLSIQIENLESANSRIRDVDYAAETAHFTQTKIIQAGGASVLAHANQAPEIALSLLR